MNTPDQNSVQNNDRAIVKDFVSTRWSDEKVALVYAFNQDGGMNYGNPCSCLLGVDSSDMPHQDCSTGHYIKVKFPDGYSYRPSDYRPDPYMAQAEAAYGRLDFVSQPERDRIMGEILREVMDEREAQKQARLLVGEAMES